MEQWGDTPRKYSAIWKEFTNLGNNIASCNTCKKKYSYKSSVSNLTKHYQRFHVKNTDDDVTDCSDGEWSNRSDDDTKNINKDISKNENKSTWQYFDVLDSDKFVAKCKVCDKEVPYDSVSDLREHAKEHDTVVSDDEDWDVTKVRNSNSMKKYDLKRVNSSKVWGYMRIIDDVKRIAMCVLCKKQLSFMTSISNLTKHVKRAHSNINLQESTSDVNSKKMLISADGLLYEVETSDGEKDPIHTDEVYLEDSMDGEIFKQIQNKIVSHKKEKPIKRKLVSKELFQGTNENIDSDEDTPKNTRYDTPKIHTNICTTQMDSIDCFAQYIVSLLRQLPKHVSDQLQSDMIKQVFAAKLGIEAPYSVTLSDKPVTVTINNGIGNGMPEITLHNTSDDIKENNQECET